MGFNDTIVLFENFNEPLDPVTNNVPTLVSEAKIKLDSNQEYQFARIFVQVCMGSVTGGAFRVEFNGRTLGSRTFGPFENGCKSLDVRVTQDMINGSNKLKIHLDGRLSIQNAVVYADLFYELVGLEPPESVEVGDPEKENKTRDLIITAGIVVGVVAVVGIVLNSFLNKGKKILS